MIRRENNLAAQVIYQWQLFCKLKKIRSRYEEDHSSPSPSKEESKEVLYEKSNVGEFKTKSLKPPLPNRNMPTAAVPENENYDENDEDEEYEAESAYTYEDDLLFVP